MSGGEITSYIDDPACPKDLDISSSTNGVIVTSIGDGAFSYIYLTSLTIPDSVTNIGDFAFATNLLSEVTINGDPDLGYGAFSRNAMSPADYSWPGNSTNILHVYATTPDFVVENPSELYMLYGDVSKAQGAFIANPASVSVSYQNEAGEELLPDYITVDGERGSSYALSRLMTSDDETTNAENLLKYFVGGTNFALPIPEVAGYATPNARTVTLNAGLNEFTVVYASANDQAAELEGDSSMPGVPDTGVKKVGYSIASIAMLTMAAGAMATVLRKRAE